MPLVYLETMGYFPDKSYVGVHRRSQGEAKVAIQIFRKYSHFML